MRWRLALVAVLVLLGGCAGFGSSPDTPTLTPAPVPSETPELGPGPAVVPGVWDDGRIERTSLLEAHREALANHSFVWRETHNRSGPIDYVRTDNSTYAVIRFENESRYYYETDDAVGSLLSEPTPYRHYSEYANGTYRYFRAIAYAWNWVQYERAPLESDAWSRLFSHTTQPIDRYLQVESVSIDPVRIDGQRHYRLVGSKPEGTWSNGKYNYSVTAVVRPDGLVRALSARYERERGDAMETVRYRFSFERLGNVTVQGPEWLPHAEWRIKNR